MIKVGVIFGGESVEHEVSIISAVQAMNKLDNEKYDIVPIYISKENTEYYQQYNNQYNGTQYENANWTRYLDQLNSKAYPYSLRNKVEQSLIRDNFEY